MCIVLGWSFYDSVQRMILSRELILLWSASRVHICLTTVLGFGKFPDKYSRGEIISLCLNRIIIRALFMIRRLDNYCCDEYRSISNERESLMIVSNAVEG